MAGQIHIVSKLGSMKGFRVVVDREHKPPKWAFAENEKGERLIIYGDFREAFGLKNIARAFERSGLVESSLHGSYVRPLSGFA